MSKRLAAHRGGLMLRAEQERLTQETTQLAVRRANELAVTETAPVVVDPRWRTIRVRRDAAPVDRPRSVVLPAALVTLAICGASPLVFLLAEVVAK